MSISEAHSNRRTNGKGQLRLHVIRADTDLLYSEAAKLEQTGTHLPGM